MLQWDRAFDSAEGQIIRLAENGNSVLQWDRAFDSAEGRRAANAGHARSGASMGPRI